MEVPYFRWFYGWTCLLVSFLVAVALPTEKKKRNADPYPTEDIYIMSLSCGCGIWLPSIRSLHLIYLHLLPFRYFSSSLFPTCFRGQLCCRCGNPGLWGNFQLLLNQMRFQKLISLPLAQICLSWIGRTYNLEGPLLLLVHLKGRSFSKDTCIINSEF